MSPLVYVNNPNGTTYVYENTLFWNSKIKKTQHKRKGIGKLDPISKEIIPTHKKEKKANSENIDYRCTITGSGISLLLDKITEETQDRSSESVKSS